LRGEVHIMLMAKEEVEPPDPAPNSQVILTERVDPPALAVLDEADQLVGGYGDILELHQALDGAAKAERHVDGRNLSIVEELDEAAHSTDHLVKETPTYENLHPPHDAA